MTINMQRNSTLLAGHWLVDATVEQDDGIFLAITVSSEESDSDQDTVDLYTTDQEEIEQFFEDVAEAKATWERLKKDNP